MKLLQRRPTLEPSTTPKVMGFGPELGPGGAEQLKDLQRRRAAPGCEQTGNPDTRDRETGIPKRGTLELQ